MVLTPPTNANAAAMAISELVTFMLLASGMTDINNAKVKILGIAGRIATASLDGDKCYCSFIVCS